MTSRSKILVVDRDPGMRVLLRTAMLGIGNVRQAADGAGALRCLFRGGPTHLVVLDLRLPDMSGLELLYRITQRQPNLPIVAMVTTREVGAFVQDHFNGPIEYIAKPFHVKQLRSVAAQILLSEESMHCASVNQN